MELREQVGVALLVQLAPVDELPRAWEAEERGDVEVDEPAWNSFCAILRCDFRTAVDVSLPSRSTVFFAAVATSKESRCSTRALRITEVAHFAKRAT